jgi:hypothetical protein
VVERRHVYGARLFDTWNCLYSSQQFREEIGALRPGSIFAVDQGELHRKDIMSVEARIDLEQVRKA